jgi:hypothetical protein
LVTVKADLAAIGTSQQGNEGALVTIDPQGFEGTGASSGTTVNSWTGGSVTQGVSGIRTMRTFPTIALGSNLPSNGVADGRLIHFAVTADSHGSLGLASFKFKFATTSANIAAGSLYLYGYTDAGYSTPISGVGTGGIVNVATSTSADGSSAVIIPNMATTGTIQVPAGQTYYFELRGTVSGTNTNYNIATTLLGDSSFTGMVTAASASSTSNFVWSPNTLTTSALSATDWTNGSGLVGLPSSGIISNRTQ